MLVKVCEKRGLSLWKHTKKDYAVIYDKCKRVLAKGSIYQTGITFAELTK